MRVTRCHVPQRLCTGETLSLPATAATHVARVLRLRAGAALTLFDGHGGEYDAQILQLDRHGVQVRVGVHHAVDRESPLAVTLIMALARQARMDWIVQKATELGVTAIVPVTCDHSVVQLDNSAGERKREHWQAVAIGACEQCGRNRPPELRPIQEFEPACAKAAARTKDIRLMLAPDGAVTLVAALGAPTLAREAGMTMAVTLLIGPEGGLSSNEQSTASLHGFQACRLGPRVLRTETAPLAALAIIQAINGDFTR